MDWFKQLTRPSSWMVYLSLLLTFAGRHFAEGSARYALMTAGTALLAGAIMNVISDGRKRNALACAVRRTKRQINRRENFSERQLLERGRK